jgi:hypothetical protein
MLGRLLGVAGKLLRLPRSRRILFFRPPAVHLTAVPVVNRYLGLGGNGSRVKIAAQPGGKSVAGTQFIACRPPTKA